MPEIEKPDLSNEEIVEMRRATGLRINWKSGSENSERMYIGWARYSCLIDGDILFRSDLRSEKDDRE